MTGIRRILGLCLLACQVIYLNSFILNGNKYPFQDTSLSIEKRVDDLVNRLNIHEHTQQMAIGQGAAPDIKRLGIGHYEWWTNCGRGDVGNDATSFPASIGLAAAWDADLMFRVARASAMETRAFNNYWVKKGVYGTHKGLSCFSPNMDIYRDPRWGRNPETWGEDPYFGTVYTNNFVKGIHGDDKKYLLTSASCKHYVTSGGPENIPISRWLYDAKVSERDLQTTYLPGFKACVDAGSPSVLCAYNKINGVPACTDKHILQDILRRDWGFKGYVVSDCGAMEAMVHRTHYYKDYETVATEGLKAGMNLNCHGSGDNAYLYIDDAVSHNKLSENYVKEMAKPLWETRMRLGEFDPDHDVKYRSLGMDIVQSQAHRDLAIEAAMKSFVLLKNDNHFLPLNSQYGTKGKFGTIAIVGPQGDNIHDQSGGYSPNVMEKYATSVKDGLKDLGNTVHTVNGCQDSNHCTKYDKNGILNAVQHADVVFVCLGLGNKLEHEGTDRRDLKLPGHQLDILKDSIAHSPHNTKIVLIMMNSGPFDIEEFDKNDKVAAIIELFYPSQSTGEALRRLITHAHPGDVFSGKLPMTWMTDLSKVPPMTDFSMKERTYRYISYTPLYPFGYGLSYTTFKYSNLQLKQTTVQAGWHIQGSYDIENTGPLDADEVSQVYIKFVNPSEPAPKIQLGSFHRTHLHKREKKTVRFIVHGQSISLWNDKNGWIVAPGTVNLYIGGQQPNQHRQISSNILQTSVKISGHHTFGRGQAAKWYPTTS
ncbi:hypothetical protein SNE40_005493 [Patella caerulea]|uniref:Fibronectin type III-like domain-containing protein n=1 Tax=Patella caerulea TaxID=87958 RepID=A0AAN8K7Z4_PATCE